MFVKALQLYSFLVIRSIFVLVSHFSIVTLLAYRFPHHVLPSANNVELDNRTHRPKQMSASAPERLPDPPLRQ